MNGGFFEELQRRKVYRVAAAYIVAGGFIVQMVSAAFPAWELPNWSQRLVIALILIGFPIALIFAWIFDLTPQGIERTSKAVPQTLPKSHRRRNVILLGVVGLVIAAAAGFFVLPRAAAHKIDKSIAVLPFENFSDDKENAYFADGIQDDVLTDLSKIGDLKVISRTSVMGYRGQTKNVREIGKALGVSRVLEGSVRRYGNKVRVNVQLIDANTDQHLWAEDFDGDLVDVFKIQTEIAGKIADALQAKLSPSEKARIEQKPTENNAAYLAFMKGHELHSSMEDYGQLQQAEKAYDEALRLDPKFARACALYSHLESWIYKNYDPTPLRRDKALQLAERALTLDPKLPEAHLARGFCYYYGDRNYRAALDEFAIAQRDLPNESEVYLAIGAIQRRQGNWKESTANLEKAAELNPKSVWPLQNLAFNYEMLRNGDAAIATIDRALQIKPDSFVLLGLKAQFSVEQRGDFAAADAACERIKYLASLTNASPQPGASPVVQTSSDMDASHLAVSYVALLVLERRFDEALRVLSRVEDSTLRDKPEALWTKFGYEGICRRYLHDDKGAQTALLKAKQVAQEAVDQTPDNAARRSQLAVTLAWLGQKEAALAEAQRAVQLLPESVDSFDGPQMTEMLAEVYAINGDAAHAVEMLEGLLDRPSAVTVHLLKTHVAWDAIRDDPRFKAMIEKHSAKA